MEKQQNYSINLSAPNLLNICIDETDHGEIQGRIYNCYTNEPVEFANVVELIRKTEDFFDTIGFPQAATQTRSFGDKAAVKQQKPLEKVIDQNTVIQNRGALGSFITIVKFRQNSTWQGELYWIERDEKQEFFNSLDFVKLIDLSLAQ